MISHALLFAIFAVASRYIDEDMSELPKDSMWTAGLAYSTQTRHILCERGNMYLIDHLVSHRRFIVIGKHPSRVSSVQALILTAYFDVGVGAMASAWHSSGLAVRTALDIGLNRPVDEWITPEGDAYFNSRQVETCRRVWYGVLLLEK